jgi:LysR family transcriptional regulator, nitrogen assimilation regulatory protein
MDIKQIRYFIYVAKLRSFSKAAQALSIAQPALSRQIQLLEEELHTQLLFRTTRGVEPTDAGRTLLEMGQSMLSYVDQMREAVTRSSRHPAGHVTLGVPPSLSTSLGQMVLEACRQTLPDVNLRVTEGLSVFLEEWLTLGRIDIAVLTDGGDVPRLANTPLACEEMMLVGPPDLARPGQDTIPLAQVAEMELTITHGFRAIVDRRIEPTGLKLRYVGEFDSIPILKELLFRGICTTILPHSLIRQEGFEEGLAVLRISEPSLTRQLVTSINPGRPITAGIKAVQDVIGSCAKTLFEPSN